MLSLPRDTRTEIVGHGKTEKINHAYAYGGIPMAINTVESYLDIPIDYYVKMNMEGFQEIVDAVGGVTVGQFGERLGQPCVWVDAGELAVLDECGDHRPVVAAFVGTGEQGVLAI